MHSQSSGGPGIEFSKLYEEEGGKGSDGALPASDLKHTSSTAEGLLKQKNLKSPIIFVAHSYGGIIVKKLRQQKS